jgi:hypothetical protein
MQPTSESIVVLPAGKTSIQMEVFTFDLHVLKAALTQVFQLLYIIYKQTSRL